MRENSAFDGNKTVPEMLSFERMKRIALVSLWCFDDMKPLAPSHAVFRPSIPTLAMFNDKRRGGRERLVPGEGRLWVVTLARRPNQRVGRQDCYEITSGIGANHTGRKRHRWGRANRMIHASHSKLFIGPYWSMRRAECGRFHTTRRMAPDWQRAAFNYPERQSLSGPPWRRHFTKWM